MSKNYDRQIKLRCSTCGHDQFEGPDEAQTYICQKCDRRFCYEELVETNGEEISEELSKIAKEVRDDLVAQFKSSFKKAGWKVK
jgi:hypothetical protein